jgi:hypothetical protein
MPGTDFSKYHSYKWVLIEGGQHPDQIIDAEIKQSVDKQLASKGLTKTETDNADVYVRYQIAVDKEKQWNAYGMGGPVRWGDGNSYEFNDQCRNASPRFLRPGGEATRVDGACD